MFEEFKKFISRGNVIDLAVGVIIGGAFSKITTSLVNDMVMPVIGVILGKINFSNLKFIIKEGAKPEDTLSINYGLFIQNIIDFLIISFTIFIVIKVINKFKEKEATKEAEKPKEPPKEEVLLTEIRDLLRNNNENK